ncbi:MAG: TolC family protein [Thermoguttaceae bacterium]
MLRWTLALGLIVLIALACPAQLATAQPFRTDGATGGNPPGGPLLAAPAIVQESQVPAVPPAQANQPDQTLSINLATALYLSQARPLIIASAQASVAKAAAQLQGANALWLPDLHFGAGYSHQDGANQGTEGSVLPASFGSYYAGGGATLNVAVTDALFRPLAARQELCARRFDLQAAHNDALLTVAQSYFEVQEARGRLAGILYSAAKAEELVRQIDSLAKGLVPEMEVDRARGLLADLNQQAAAARTTWRIASARLARALRLYPGSVVIPQEPACLRVTLISSQYALDDLIPCGLLNRPELASQKAAVQATLELLRQEKVRPLLPSVVLEGGGPDGDFNGGVFGGGRGGDLSTSSGRAEVNLGLVWSFQNLGLGNKAQVRGRAADKEKAVVELFELQDRVAEEVVQSHASVEGAWAEIPQAEAAVREATITLNGTLKGLTQIRGAGNFLQPVSRPQEGVAALQQLNQAYQRYFIAINQYNRAQFQLYHAIGYPSHILANEGQMGEVQAISANVPTGMAPYVQSASRYPDPNRR